MLASGKNVVNMSLNTHMSQTPVGHHSVALQFVCVSLSDSLSFWERRRRRRRAQSLVGADDDGGGCVDHAF